MISISHSTVHKCGILGWSMDLAQILHADST